MKNERDIKELAEKICALEKELQLGKNVQENQEKIEKIMSTLSMGEMIMLDDYIYKNQLLTK